MSFRHVPGGGPSTCIASLASARALLLSITLEPGVAIGGKVIDGETLRVGWGVGVGDGPADML